MKIVERKIKDLRRAEYNPRKANQKKKRELRDSLQKYGFVDPVIVNINPERKDIVIGGHQRLDEWYELGNDTVPTVELDLSLEDEKELNIRLNRSTGVFDIEKLGLMFNKDKLMEIGFEESEIKKIENEFQQKLSEFDNLNCDYPLVPKFNEKHDYILIVCQNDMDTLRLRTILGIEKQK